MSATVDCTDVDKLVQNQVSDRWAKFQLVYRLTIWELGCLKQIKNAKDRRRYPEEQEKILIEDIKRGIINVKPDLIRLDVKSLKYIGVVLRDYQVGGDIEFNEFLVNSLLDSYGSVADAASKKLNQKQRRKKPNEEEPKWKPEWKRTMEDIKNDGQIQKYFDPKSTKKPEEIYPRYSQIQNYLELRRNIESLSMITSKFDELKQHLKGEEYSVKDYNLALQRLFHITGEFLKDTAMTPNLSENIRISLMDRGVPVELLTNFRDLLAHHQLFPLIELSNEEIENLLENDFLPMKNAMESKISELEQNYIRGIIEQKLSRVGDNSKLQTAFRGFLDKSREGVRELLESVQKSNLWKTNKDVADLYQIARRMKSRYFSPQGRQELGTKFDSSNLGDFMIKNKLKMYGKLHKEIESWKKYKIDGIGTVLETHEKVMAMIDVIDHLRGGTPSSKKKLEDFIASVKQMEGFDRITVKLQGGGDSTLKEELKKYFDAEDFSSNYEWNIPDHVKPNIDRMIENSNGAAEAKKKVSDFLKLFVDGGGTVSLTNEEYRKCVKSLKLDEATKNKFLQVEINDGKVNWNNLSEDTNLEYFLDVLNKIGGNSSNKGKLKNFFDMIKTTRSRLLAPNQYKDAIEELKLNNAADRTTLLSLSVDWKKKECARLLNKYCDLELKNVYDAIIQGKMDLVPKVYKEFIPKVAPRLDELYDRRIKEEIDVLGNLKNPNAVESQIINVYSLLDNAQRKSGKNIDGSAEETPSGTSIETVEEKDDMKKFRNYLAHGDALTSNEEQMQMSKQLVGMKDTVVNELQKVTNSGGNKIDIPRIESILDGVELSTGILTIKKILCPRNSRTARSVKGCLTWEDIQKVVDEEMETVDPDIIKINSEKLMSTLAEEMDEDKFYNYIALAGESEVEGEYKHEVKGLVNHHEAYIKHLDKVAEFSGKVMHGMIAKDILGDILRGDYKGVAIDVGFFSGSIGMAKVAEMAALKGASFVERGSVVLGKSLKFASPFLARGVSAFIAYDLWNQVKDYKSGNKDALVSVVGDSIQLGVDAAEVGIEIAEGLSLVEGISATTGPIGMAIGATIFVGVEVYKAVRAVKKIDEKVHLTGWEKFTQGWRSFFGMGPKDYLRELEEEKDGNNAAVQNAINFLKGNRDIQRYVFPSFVHVDGKLVSALNSVVYLSEKVNNIKWTRSRPDDQDDINLFCKPKGDWENVPATGTYLCENAIGVEYKNDRTGNNTLINLGKGVDTAKGFKESGNVFVIYQTNAIMYGGNEDDLFLFHNEGDDELTGSIDGMGGLNTVDVGGLPKNFEVVADFQEKSLKYEDLDMKSSFVDMKSIQKFRGMPGSRDRVVAACDTTLVDGMGGGDRKMDEIVIPNEPCRYDTTIVVGPSTRVNNDATGNSTFRFIIKGEKGRISSYVNLKEGSAARNTILFHYTLKDIAAIDRSERNIIKFSFVERFYENNEELSDTNSFNITVQGVVQNTYLTSDNTRIVVGSNKLYALQNTDEPIDDIMVGRYVYIMNKLGMIAVVHSNNEVLTIGGSDNEVIHNDPSAEKSHFASGDGENIFSFISGQEKLSKGKLPINDSVVHYFSKVNSIDTLDLRKIKEQLKNDLGHDMEANISVISGDDLLITLYFDDGRRTKLLMSITLKNVLEYLWYSKIHLMMDTIFTIEKSGEEFILVPRPLMFDDENDSLFILSPKDVAEGIQVKVAKKLGGYDFARQGNSLFITNSFSLDAYKKPLVTVMLAEFYNSTFENKMQSLKFYFHDRTIALNQTMNRIINARNFVELKREARAELYTNLSEAIKSSKELFEAINQGRIQEAKRIIDRYDVFVSSKNACQVYQEKRRRRSNRLWMDPLVYAANKGVLEIVKYLVMKGADVFRTDGFGHTPVYYAVRNNHQDVTDFFISKLSTADDEGMMAIAAELPVVKYLEEIRGGRYLKLIDQTNSTLVHYAVMDGNLDVVKYLFEEAQDLKGDFKAIDKRRKTPMEYAVEYHNYEVVDYLSAVMTKEGTTSLCFNSQIGKLEIVKYLIDEKGADVYEKDRSGWTPLHHAIHNSRTDVIDYLSKVIMRDGEGQLLAYPSITNDAQEVGSYLTDKGASLNGWNAFGKAPLHYAAIHCNLDMMKLLIDKCADVTAKDKFGFIPKHYITTNSDPSCNKRAMFSALDKFDRCPETLTRVLQSATYKGENGVRQKRADPSNKISLHTAAKRKQLELVKHLIEGGYDPNVKDQLGRTPLHYAAAHGDMSVVKYLVEHGSDVLEKDNNAYTPVMLAQGDPQIKDYLQETIISKKRHDLENQQGLQSSLNFTQNGDLIEKANTTSVGQDIYGVLSWVKSSVSGFLNTTSEDTQKPPFSLSASQVDTNGTIMLLNLMIRKATGQKYTATVDRVESPLEIQGYALNVVETFEDVLNATALELNIPESSIDFDPLSMQSAVMRHKRYGSTSEIPKLLFSFAEKSCLEFERTKEFLERFRINLEQVVEDKNELLLPKIDHVSITKPHHLLDDIHYYPMFSNKYGVVVRATEADIFKEVGDQHLNSVNVTSNNFLELN